MLFFVALHKTLYRKFKPVSLELVYLLNDIPFCGDYFNMFINKSKTASEMLDLDLYFLIINSFSFSFLKKYVIFFVISKKLLTR